MHFQMSRSGNESGSGPVLPFADPERLLRNFVHDSAVATFLVTSDGKIAYVNSAVANLLGYEPDELAGGFDFARLVHPEDLDSAREHARLLLSGAQKSYQAERRYIAKDGQVVWAAALVSLLPEADGSAPYLSVQAISIDRQKQAEGALAENERRWNFALESADQGVWEVDIARGLNYYSPMWRRMRGIGADEVVDTSLDAWYARLHPEDRPWVTELVRAQSAGRTKRNTYEYRERHRDGHYIWIASKGAAEEWAADGSATRITGTDTDITQRKLAQDAMQALSDRLELALDASRIGVFETNLETGEVFWDDRVHDIFGIDPNSEVDIAATWERALHPEDAPQTLTALAEAIAARGTFKSQFRILRPDGEIRHVASQARYFKNAHSAPKLVGTNRDVTEEVALTHKLELAKMLAEDKNRELEVAKAHIENQSLHDALTGLPNRRYLDQVLGAYLESSRAGTAGPLALLHIDLDRFKQINDTLGHVAGDAMLVHVARLLSENAGLGNFVARVGGDEFVIVCPLLTDNVNLAALAERLITKIRQPVNYEGHMCRFGASIGIALNQGTQIGPKQILMNGDIALYRAKSRGKNRFEFFSQSLQDEIESTKRLADDILRGIEQHEFVPHYQPLVDATNLRVTSVEALARWHHPTDGVLAPARFLKVAEDLNVLSAIDAAVLERAISDRESWSAIGFDVPSVSVNVSFRRLHDEELLPSLRRLNIEPGTISFEFLESIFLDEFSDTVAWNIDAIREMGIGIDVDDFGTGHTSFVSLLKISPDRFKIDRQLIAPIASNTAQRRLVGSIIEIGKTLGIKVVAEGVETMEQATILRKLGCDLLQGYAFAQPMCSSQLVEWLRQNERPARRRASR